ncbi:MAG: hypothetical protein COB12_00260 [Flavobacterium sp.]|nr:MAG: hypothetical protein COB12_00260 [Flavobacterium sp.]
MFNNILKGFSLFLISFVLFSCSSSDDTDETCCDVYPSETRKFISKIYFESTANDLDEYIYDYDSNSNLISINKNESLVTFVYTGNKITRAEVTNLVTGELINYVNYFYNPEGLLDYYEGDYQFSRVVKYTYENQRVVKYHSYLSLTDLENNNYVRYVDAFYNDNTNNIVEFKAYNSNGELERRSTRSFGAENKRYFGEAAELINMPYSNQILESFNYYSNNNLKGWRTYPNSTELILYRESSFVNDDEGYCLIWKLDYYNTTSGEVELTYTKTYEYIEL